MAPAVPDNPGRLLSLAQLASPTHQVSRDRAERRLPDQAPAQIRQQQLDQA